MQCQAPALPKKILSVGSLAARETRSAAFCSSARSSCTSSHQNTASLFSYWYLFNLNPVAQGVCVCVYARVCVCARFNTRRRLKTHLREKAGEAAPDREAVSSGRQQPGGAEPRLCWILTLQSWMELWEQSPRTAHEVGNTSRFSRSFLCGCEDK